MYVSLDLFGLVRRKVPDLGGPVFNLHSYDLYHYSNCNDE